jgi:hypothetical protein
MLITSNGTYSCSFVTHIFRSGQPTRGRDSKTFEVMTSTWLQGTLGSVASLSAATLYQGNHERNHKVWNIALTERYILIVLHL